MPVGIRELFRRGLERAAAAFVASTVRYQHGRRPGTNALRDFVRSQLLPGESIRSDTLANFVERLQRANEIAGRINRGIRPLTASYPLGSDIPDCQGFVYRTIWEVDFPSETDPGEFRRIRVPIEVHSDRPLSRAEILRDSSIAAMETEGKRGKYLTLSLGLEFQQGTPVYKGVVSAFRC